jgi:hypothetical protein
MGTVIAIASEETGIRFKGGKAGACVGGVA